MLLPVYEQVELELSKLPSLIKLIEQNSPLSLKECDRWFCEIIVLCEKYYLSISSELAVIKGKLTFYSKPKDADRHEGKKALSRYMIECLDSARKLIRDYFDKFKQSILVCESACLQTISAIWVSGMFGETVPDVDMLWEMSLKEPELLKAISQIVGMVGTANARILLDRAIPQVYLEKGE